MGGRISGGRFCSDRIMVEESRLQKLLMEHEQRIVQAVVSAINDKTTRRFARDTAATGLTADQVAARVLADFPQILQLEPVAQEARLRHIAIIAQEACESAMGSNIAAA